MQINISKDIVVLSSPKGGDFCKSQGGCTDSLRRFASLCQLSAGGYHAYVEIADLERKREGDVDTEYSCSAPKGYYEVIQTQIDTTIESLTFLLSLLHEWTLKSLHIDREILPQKQQRNKIHFQKRSGLVSQLELLFCRLIACLLPSGLVSQLES